MDGSTKPSENVNWGCQGDPAISSRPIDCGTKRVKVEVVFPDCQAVSASGVPMDDSPNHRDHMAYSSANGRCPSTHPYKVAQLHLHVIYKATNGKNLTFSVPTYDFHADFMNGWDQGVYDQLLRECIEGQQYGCEQIASSTA
jgi:hypothetical protein